MRRWLTLVAAGIAVETVAAAPRLLCYPVMRGDTVVALSVRLMRDPQGWRDPRFQLLDPAAARFVSKADYRQIHPGLQACVVEPPLTAWAAGDGRWWILLLLSSTAATVFFAVQSSLDRRNAASAALRTFGAAFIREFERPLRDERSPTPVLRSELELSPDRKTLEVRIAPAEGRRYPNLTDHRSNLEYDVARVTGVLNDRRFTRGPLRVHGEWVAIPFVLSGSVRLQPGRDKEGGA